ncbi:MAG: hypothetical protein AAF727_03520 [Pseudomonadota bacterium]
MTGVQLTLLAIAVFVCVAVGLFVWFIANWDKDKTQPIGMEAQQILMAAPLFSGSKNPRVRGSAPVRAPKLAERTG